MRNPALSPASLPTKDMKTARSARAARHLSEDASLWLVLAAGLALVLVAAAARGEETVNRVERFNAALARGATVRVDNLSGDLVATPGLEFRAVVEINVTAPTRERAQEVLEGVRIVQSSDGNAYSLETVWPRSVLGWDRHGPRRYRERCQDCKVSARYELTIPPGVAASLETLNGEVRARDLDGRLRLRSVNGSVEASGVRHPIDARTVNGAVRVSATALPPSAEVDLQTVNGKVLLTLPKDARFALSASTMNGAIASTFELPKSGDDLEAVEVVRRPRAPRARESRQIVVNQGEDGVSVVDVKELEEELENSLKRVEVEVQDSVRELREIRILDPRRTYQGTLGGGGAAVRLNSLNGEILLLASGSREEEAKRVVPQRRSFVVTIPEIKISVPRIRVVPRPIVRINPQLRPAPRPAGAEGEIVQGDVIGNFVSTHGGGDYTVGRVSGSVKILSHSGEIRVLSAGAGADLKTLGGDIKIDSVTGSLRAHTGAGDIRAGTIEGAFFAETAGGDIRAEKVVGAVDARTGGGDIVLLAVGGRLQAQTAGGSVRLAIVSPTVKGGVAIRNAGGDVSLTLPSDFRGDVELIVVGSPEVHERLVRSDFPELSVTRRHDGVYASGTLNGGGPKVVVRTTSGVIRLRKGPPAGG